LEVVVTYFNVLSQHSSGETEEEHEGLSSSFNTGSLIQITNYKQQLYNAHPHSPSLVASLSLKLYLTSITLP
jgi:hypothetical protein